MVSIYEKKLTFISIRENAAHSIFFRIEIVFVPNTHVHRTFFFCHERKYFYLFYPIRYIKTSVAK